MIAVSDAFAFVTPDSAPSVSPPEFTREEERTIVKLEGAIDAIIIHQFTGTPPQIHFKEGVPQKIADEVVRRYRAGGWQVHVELDLSQKPRRGYERGTLFTFVPARLSTKTIKVAKTSLPQIQSVPMTAAAPGQKRLLVRMPTRARPEKALSVLAKYRAMAGCPILLEVVLDEDDETMINAPVMQRLSALGCTVTVGRHKSKVEAVNDGRVTEWDVLLLASDDMVPVVDGYGKRVLEVMEQYWPHLDGAIYSDDGYQGKDICTAPVMGKRWYDQWGYVYHPDYRSLVCDREMTELWTAMERLQYIDEKLIEHWHPAWGFGRKDELYKRNDALEVLDQATYEQRKVKVWTHSQFAFGTPPMWLSICICTLPDRRIKLDRLLDELYTQYEGSNATADILVDSREGVTIGEKRQALLERARGHYVGFVDDDDWVHSSYVHRTIDALRDYAKEKGQFADCASLVGEMATNGECPQRFEHSVDNAEWSERDGKYLRSPNHLNAVRRDLALKAGFPSSSHGEDFHYSQRLRPLIQTEASTGDEPLYYYLFDSTKRSA